MSVKITADEISFAIMKELKEYSQESSEKLKKGLDKLAKDTAKELKSVSPKKTGDYAKGWTAKKAFESQSDIRIVVHNKKKPGLPHLLEYGHASAKGGRTVGKREHIKPVENKVKELAEKVVKEAYGM